MTFHLASFGICWLDRLWQIYGHRVIGAEFHLFTTAAAVVAAAAIAAAVVAAIAAVVVAVVVAGGGVGCYGRNWRRNGQVRLDWLIAAVGFH